MKLWRKGRGWKNFTALSTVAQSQVSLIKQESTLWVKSVVISDGGGGSILPFLEKFPF